MRRKGEVDGMAGATAFFHRGLCPLCGGGFRRCRFETLLFTPTEERRQMPSGLPPLRLWRGIDCKKSTPDFLGCFCFSGKCSGKFACVGIVLGKWCSGIATRLPGDARELPPQGQYSPCLAAFSKPVPPCGTPQLFPSHYSLFTDFQPSRSML